VFNDALFKNTTYKLRINTFYDINERTRIILETGTENYYLYRKRFVKHEPYSYQDPFNPYDPVQLFSNVENGLGIFAGYQATSISINTDDLKMVYLYLVPGIDLDEVEIKVLEQFLYFENLVNIKPVNLNIGGRLSHFLVNGKYYIYFEPRLSAGINLYKDVIFKCQYAFQSYRWFFN